MKEIQINDASNQKLTLKSIDEKIIELNIEDKVLILNKEDLIVALKFITMED